MCVCVCVCVCVCAAQRRKARGVGANKKKKPSGREARTPQRGSVWGLELDVDSPRLGLQRPRGGA